MNLAAVMDQVGDQLDTIEGLHVYRYPPDRIEPPAGIIAYPDTLTFDETYARGMDRLTLPVLIVVGRVSDRASRDALTRYCAGSGVQSVKQVLESGDYTALDELVVTGAEFDAVTIAGAEYVAALFDLDIAGQGGT